MSQRVTHLSRPARTRRPSGADSLVEDHYRLKRLEMALSVTSFLRTTTQICYENMPQNDAFQATL